LLLSARRAGDIDRLLQQLQAVPRYFLATGTVAIVLFFVDKAKQEDKVKGMFRLLT